MNTFDYRSKGYFASQHSKLNFTLMRPVSHNSYVDCEKYKITKIDFLKVALLIIYNLREFLMGIDGANLCSWSLAAGDGEAPLHPVLILPDFNNNRPSM